MPDDVTLGEVARLVNGIIERLDRNDATQQQQMQMYVLRDTWNRAEMARDRELAAKDKEIAAVATGLADMRTTRENDAKEEAKTRRQNQIIVGLALLGTFVNILLSLVGHVWR